MQLSTFCDYMYSTNRHKRQMKGNEFLAIYICHKALLFVLLYKKSAIFVSVDGRCIFDFLIK